MTTSVKAIEYLHNHHQAYLSELIEFIKIPSISTLPENAKDVNQAAEFLARKLKSLGVEHVEVFPTARHPIVYGDYIHAGSDQPTVLVYGHYDVQPVDPIELWKHEPFTPTQVGDDLFARGASDMKGQIWAVISAIESIMRTDTFPVNLKFIVEGEEEIGSLHFDEFLVAHKDLLSASYSLNADTGMLAPDLPTIVYGLRGLAYFEIKVYGPSHDLHSGVFGGVVQNPAQVLADLVSGMRDKDGIVQLPHFYDKVVPLTAQERTELARLKMDDAYYQNQTGAPATWGEKGYTPVERTGGRPTLDVNGLLSGFIGAGAKTVIPAWAMAKLSTRLVPDQSPDDVRQQLTEYMQEHAPKTVTWSVEQLSGGSPSISDINTYESRALADALEIVWGVKPTYKREGGSVPVVSSMQKVLGIDSVLTGFGLPDDNIHSPNEKLHLPSWIKGMEALVHFFYNAKR